MTMASAFDSLETILLAVALLLLLSVLASKASSRLGVPSLVVFIGVGMLAGSEGIGGIEFDDARAAQYFGVLALVFILFAGGLDTHWRFVRGSIARAASLATVGVLLTAGIIALFAWRFLHLSPAEGFLLGAIVSSTDAAAVFSILRGRGVELRDDIVSTLELESGSNDPMAVFLTLSAIQYVIGGSEVTLSHFLLEFTIEMSVGMLIGIAAGTFAVRAINRLGLEQGGLYPVLTIAMVLLTYAAAHLAHGNGFLAVYVAGLTMGTHNFLQKRRLTKFHEGIAWLMQIGMFIVLGLLVFPSHLLAVTAASVGVALVLVFVARPIAVLASLALSSFNWRERLLVGWVGLRGAVPIVLATFPLLAGVPKAGAMFNVVFFVALVSVMIQGTTIPLIARWLGLDGQTRSEMRDEEQLSGRGESALITVSVTEGSEAEGKRIVDLREWPSDSRVLVLYRGDEFFIPEGATEMQQDDRLIILTNKNAVDRVRRLGEGES